MDGVLAGFVDVTPFLRQSATVENLINSERRGIESTSTQTVPIILSS